MVHVVLPKVPAAPPAITAKRGITHLPGKCADTAIPHLFSEIEKAGAQAARLRAAIIGGAQIFTPAPSTRTPSGATVSRLEIGPRNVEAVKSGLAKLHIPIVAEQTGGYCGRTVTFHVQHGQVFVRPIGAEESLLVTLGERAEGAARGDNFRKEGSLRG
jgi:chemotaxis protein CheD